MHRKHEHVSSTHGATRNRSVPHAASAVPSGEKAQCAMGRVSPSSLTCCTTQRTELAAADCTSDTACGAVRGRVEWHAREVRRPALFDRRSRYVDPWPTCPSSSQGSTWDLDRTQGAMLQARALPSRSLHTPLTRPGRPSSALPRAAAPWPAAGSTAPGPRAPPAAPPCPPCRTAPAQRNGHQTTAGGLRQRPETTRVLQSAHSPKRTTTRGCRP